MPPFKHIVWDWNGTLIDDTWLCLEIMNGQLIKRKLSPITYEVYQEVFDFPVRNYYEKVGFDFTKEPYETVAGNFIGEYARRRFECSLHFGVRAVLEKYSLHGFDHYLLSAYADTALREMIEHYELSSFFVNIIGQEDHYATGKLDQGKQLMASIDSDKELIVLIGDTTHDSAVAKELGISCILLAHGHQSKRRLLACDVPVAGSFSETMLYTI
jgi:phosphoglycolate phosphatase